MAPMHVLFEEDGAFRAATILTDNDSSLQVETASGKRSKIKAASVLLRFGEPAPAVLLEQAESLLPGIEADFLWECVADGEFHFADVASEYFGRAATAVEAAALLLALHAAPIYFHRKGRGRFRKAPPEILQAALAGLEKKRQQALAIERMLAQLTSFTLPPEFPPVLAQLLYKPDRNRAESKALEAACSETGLSAAHLLYRCGAIRSPYDYHLQRFLLEQFPRGTAFPAVELPPVPVELPQADVQAFSIDDATTTEIDDAFSLQSLPGVGWRVGIHIAAPGLGIAPGSPLDGIARARLSTVYMPGSKFTMLPDEVVDRYTLASGRAIPAVSLYLTVTPAMEIIGDESRLEIVPVVANLRHHDIEPLFNERTLAAGLAEFPLRDELLTLWQLANACEMIVANTTWGALLASRGVAAIYRVQGGGKVRMSTAPQAHEGLGVKQYAWLSSPLRRYVDLLNQWQLLACLRSATPPFAARSDALFAALRDFELTYAAYAEFQRGMERYWCLRWLRQQGIERIAATIGRDNLARLDDLPLVQRVPSAPELKPGQRILLQVESVDYLTLGLGCRYLETLPSSTEEEAVDTLPEAVD